MTTKTGLHALIDDGAGLLRGRRVGLVSHPAAVLPDLTGSVDALRAAGVKLTALFGMEHGFGGAAADGLGIGDATDPRTGLPVYSLYGKIRKPTAEMLAGVDALVFDVQDVGARFYTYISTLYYLLAASGEHGSAVVVLDRPAPIDGLAVEGPLTTAGLESFVGIIPIPIRYGLTPGELARYMNAAYRLGADLTVVPMQGWRREMWFDDTGLPWVPTSPAIPHLSTAAVYPGMCLVEGTNLSEGRGTALPFEVAGAPWLDGYGLAASLNALDLPGVRFRPASFQPSSSKHAGQMCHGVQIHVAGRRSLRAVETGLHLIAACRSLAPDRFEFLPSSWEGRPPHFDLLSGDPAVREGLAAGVPVAEITKGWAGIEDEFRRQSRQYWLY